MSATAIKQGKRAPRSQYGSALIEGLLAIVVFSMGLIGLLMLQSAALIDGANAHYRSEAGLLASDLVARMWMGDRTREGLMARFGHADADEYRAWRQRVQATLPGVSDTANPPKLSIGAQRDVTIWLAWQTPGEARPHQFVVQTQITD